jgi:hypothetical protein
MNTQEREKQIQDAMVILHTHGLLHWHTDSSREYAEVSFVKCPDNIVAVLSSGYGAAKQVVENYVAGH